MISEIYNKKQPYQRHSRHFVSRPHAYSYTLCTRHTLHFITFALPPSRYPLSWNPVHVTHDFPNVPHPVPFARHAASNHCDHSHRPLIIVWDWVVFHIPSSMYFFDISTFMKSLMSSNTSQHSSVKLSMCLVCTSILSAHSVPSFIYHCRSISR